MGDDRTVDRRTYLKATGAVSSVGVAGLAGCSSDGGDGGDGDGDGGGGTTSGDGGGGTTTSGGVDTVTIASTVPESGSLSSLGQDLRRGYEIGADLMNETLDAEVDLIIRDDESDAQVVRQQLQQIVSNNDVDMIWGSFSSLLVTAGSAFAEQQGIPFLGVAFAYMAPHMNNNYEWTYAPFPKSRDVAQGTKGLFDSLPESERPSNFGIWELNSGWGAEMSDLWEQVLSEAGYNIAFRGTYSNGTQDFSSLISQSQSADVEVVLGVPIPPDAITAMKQMKSSGYSPKHVQFVRGTDPAAWWSALGQDGAYASGVPGWVPGLTGGGNEEMHQRYYEKYDVEQGSILPVMVGASYNLAQVATRTVSVAGSTEADALKQALDSTEFETVIGTFTFDQYGMPAEGELVGPVGQWWEGHHHLVYPESDGEQAIDFKYPAPPWGER